MRPETGLFAAGDFGDTKGMSLEITEKQIASWPPEAQAVVRRLMAEIAAIRLEVANLRAENVDLKKRPLASTYSSVRRGEVLIATLITPRKSAGNVQTPLVGVRSVATAICLVRGSRLK